jgi:hypothetical protein
MRIAISAGHAKKVQGAIGPSPWGLNEVDEARKVCTAVAGLLNDVAGPFFDDTSTSQNQNLNTIVNWHNKQARDLDVSVHFNANVSTPNPMGCECLYVTQEALADKVSAAMASAGHFKDRGPKYRSDLFFLNSTHEPAILLEVCFVDSQADVDLYHQHFAAICMAIARTIDPAARPEDPDGVVPIDEVLRLRGKVSHFGGPKDTGVSPDEGLAFLYKVSDKPHVFLKVQPPGTTGLARRLDPRTFYIATRWDYDYFPKAVLAGADVALVRSPKTGKQAEAHPTDWGPHVDTGRVADISPGLMRHLGIETDDEVEVIYPLIKAGKPRPEPRKAKPKPAQGRR